MDINLKNMKEIYYWNAILNRQFKSNDDPEFTAFIMTSCYQCANFISVVGLLQLAYCDVKISKDGVIIIALLLGVMAMIFNYFYLFKPWKTYFPQYEKMSGKRRVIGKFYFVLYSLFSIGAVIVSKMIVDYFECGNG